MPVITLRYVLTLALAACIRLAFGQADVAVDVTVENPRPAANELVYATLEVLNEGKGVRTDLVVSLRLSPALFFVDVAAGDGFDVATQMWTVPDLAAGESAQLRVAVQANYGGVHTLTAELVGADGPDWDSKPGNGRLSEDDQDEACISVPIVLECGQDLVLSAPRDYDTYEWYRDGELLAYATSDTIHPSLSGAYTFVVDGGEGCASGNCCPVLVERGACAADLALAITDGALDEQTGFQDIAITLYNQGHAPVTRVSLYATVSKKMRLNPGNSDWTFSLTEMTTDWNGYLAPGEEVVIPFQIQSVSGGTASDYTMYAEIMHFYGGDVELVDIDSDPDMDPTNDPMVDNAIDLPREEDEDDSDMVILTDCPYVAITGTTDVCLGETVSLGTTEAGKAIAYAWSGPYDFACRDCADASFTATAPGTVVLTTSTADGCQQVLRTEITVRDCLSALRLTAGPNQPGEVCLPVGYVQGDWCEPFDLMGVDLAFTETANGELCIEGYTSGEWGGVHEVCLSACTGADAESCSTTTLTVVGLPRKDELTASGGETVCLNEYLQVDGDPIDIKLPAAVNGVSLVALGDGCYRVQTPATSYDDALLQVVHTYNLAGTTIYDTTEVSVAGQQVCDLTVFASDTIFVEASAATAATAAGETVCLDGDRRLLTTLELEIAGQPVAAPSEGCDPYTSAKFPLNRLPRGYTDNGWQILRYVVGGRSVIYNARVANLAALAAKLAASQPGSEAYYDQAGKLIELSGYEVKPDALVILHLATRQRINIYPLIINGYRGWSLQLPQGLPVGTHSFTATDAEGCVDATVVSVTPPNQLTQQHDTIEVSVEVGEPLAAAGLSGFRAPSADWKPLGDDAFAYTAAAISGPTAHRFTKTTATAEMSKTYVVTVTERNCVPLIVDPSIVKVSSRCVGGVAQAEYVNLGLTRPDLQVTYASGSLSSASAPTGQRPGVVIPLGALPHQGLLTKYQVLSWPGVAGAAGTTGNLSEVFAHLRSIGLDVRVDWQNQQIIAAGPSIGALQLRDVSSGTTSTLTPSTSSLPTYGEFLARSGNTSVTVSGATCSAGLNVRIECEIVIFGGFFGLTTGEPQTLSLRELDLPIGTQTMRIVEQPAAMAARVSDDGQSLLVTAQAAGIDELQVEACDGAGDCQQVNVKLEARDAAVPEQTVIAEIWRHEHARVVADVNTDYGTFALPSNITAEAFNVVVDGEPISDLGERLEVITQREYDMSLGGAFTAYASPFGKTRQATGDLKRDLVEIFQHPETTAAGSRVVVSGANLGGTVHGQDINGIWRPLEASAVQREPRHVLNLAPGVHRVSVTDAVGNFDEIEVTVVAPEHSVVQDVMEVAVGEQLEYCLPTPKPGRTVVSIGNSCEGRSGEFAGVEQTDGCIRAQGYEAGTESVCLVRQYLDGGIDSFLLDISVSEPFVLALANDRDTVEMGQFKVLQVLRNDAVTDAPRQVSLISEPFFGRAQVVGNSAIEYLHYGGDCAVDVFTYEVCQGDVCESATVQVDVFCEDLLVYNGFSPNGDGVNDEFTVLGLGQYPGSTLSIFDRAGGMLIEFHEYESDWDGTVAGRPLPSGTYFYVIDLGDGSKESGYLQLSR